MRVLKSAEYHRKWHPNLKGTFQKDGYFCLKTLTIPAYSALTNFRKFSCHVVDEIKYILLTLSKISFRVLTQKICQRNMAKNCCAEWFCKHRRDLIARISNKTKTNFVTLAFTMKGRLSLENLHYTVIKKCRSTNKLAEANSKPYLETEQCVGQPVGFSQARQFLYIT